MGKKKKKGLKSYDNMGYLFVLPFVVVFLIFSVYPVFRTLYLSFTNAKIAGVRRTIGKSEFGPIKRFLLHLQLSPRVCFLSESFPAVCATR